VGGRPGGDHPAAGAGTSTRGLRPRWKGPTHLRRLRHTDAPAGRQVGRGDLPEAQRGPHPPDLMGRSLIVAAPAALHAKRPAASARLPHDPRDKLVPGRSREDSDSRPRFDASRNRCGAAARRSREVLRLVRPLGADHAGPYLSTPVEAFFWSNRTLLESAFGAQPCLSGARHRPEAFAT